MAQQPLSIPLPLPSHGPEAPGINRDCRPHLGPRSDAEMANEINPPSDRHLSFTERLAIARAKSENEVRMLQSRSVVQSRTGYSSPVPVLEMRSREELTTVRLLPQDETPVMPTDQTTIIKDKMGSSSSPAWSRFSEQETHIRPIKSMETEANTEDITGDELRDDFAQNITGDETAGSTVVFGSKLMVNDDARIVQPRSSGSLKGAESGSDNKQQDVNFSSILELNPAQTTVEPVKKNGRGRPKGSKNRPKITVNTYHQPEPQPEGPTVKRGRGQLRDSKKGPEATAKTSHDPEQQSEAPTVKRGRGRPKGSKKSTVPTIKTLDQVEQQPGFPITKREGGKIHQKIGTQDYDENHLSSEIDYECLTKRLKVTKNPFVVNQEATNKISAWEKPLARGGLDTIDDILKDALDYIVVDRMRNS